MALSYGAPRRNSRSRLEDILYGQGNASAMTSPMMPFAVEEKGPNKPGPGDGPPQPPPPPPPPPIDRVRGRPREPEPYRPPEPRPPDRSRPTDGTGTTSPDRTGTGGTGGRTAKPRPSSVPGRPRWNFRNIMASYGDMSQLGYGGMAIPELVEFLQQQEAGNERRKSRIQDLLAGQQMQSPLFSSR